MKPIVITPPKVVYRCPYFIVSETELQLDNGDKQTYYSEKGIDFVVIFVEQDNKLLMVNQYRYPINDVQLEFPAGGIEQNEEPEDAARRELLEETGYKAKNMQFLGRINPLTARCSTAGYIFSATEVEYTGAQHLDRSENGLTHMWIEVDRFKNLLKQPRKSFDALTLSTWVLYLASKE
jgi:ADP-ribose pyrophosphatase